ncbi:MAG TPA: PH domain-containing protein [Vicinamibacterales bacterium]|nr:PH domain-containing protein [Vicinamibacterales bacterium]
MSTDESPFEPATPDAPGSIADGRSRPLDPRLIAVQRLARAVFTAVAAFGTLPFVVIVILSAPGGLPGWAPVAFWSAGVGLLVWWAWAWPPVAYRYRSYSVDATSIEIRRGVVFRRIIHVPRSRVQHTDVSQGPIERSYELGTLVIYTAGTDFARIQLDGLAHATALRIRDHLLPDSGPDAV